MFTLKPNMCWCSLFKFSMFTVFSMISGILSEWLFIKLTSDKLETKQFFLNGGLSSIQYSASIISFCKEGGRSLPS